MLHQHSIAGRLTGCFSSSSPPSIMSTYFQNIFQEHLGTRASQYLPWQMAIGNQLFPRNMFVPAGEQSWRALQRATCSGQRETRTMGLQWQQTWQQSQINIYWHTTGGESYCHSRGEPRQDPQCWMPKAGGAAQTQNGTRPMGGGQQPSFLWPVHTVVFKCCSVEWLGYYFYSTFPGKLHFSARCKVVWAISPQQAGTQLVSVYSFSWQAELGGFAKRTALVDTPHCLLGSVQGLGTVNSIQL